MAMKSLEELRAERRRLLSKADAKASLKKLSREREIERRQLTKEVKALSSPRKAEAKKVASRIGKSAGRGFIRFLDNVNKNIDKNKSRKTPVRRKRRRR